MGANTSGMAGCKPWGSYPKVCVIGLPRVASHRGVRILGKDGPLLLSSLSGGCFKTECREGQDRAGQGREDVPLSLESWLNSAIRVITWLLVGRLFPKAREGSPPVRPES